MKNGNLFSVNDLNFIIKSTGNSFNSEFGEWISNEKIHELRFGENWKEEFIKKSFSSDYIQNNLGFKNRYWVKKKKDGTFPSSVDLMADAGKKALENANLQPSEIDFVISVTTTSPRYTSSTSTLACNLLGIKCPSFEMKSGCASSIFSIIMGGNLINSGVKNVLLLFGETLSRILLPNSNMQYAGGDGGAAIILSQDTTKTKGIKYGFIGSDGTYSDLMGVKGPLPPTISAIEQNEYYMSYSGEADTFIQQLWDEIPMLLYKNSHIKSEEIDFLITHQPNINAISRCATAANIDSSKTIDIVKDYANCGPVSLINAFHLLQTSEKLKEDSRLMLVSVGGGISWGGCILDI